MKKVAETNPDWILYAWYQLVPLVIKEAPEKIQYLQIGRASCRERVEISVGGGALEKKGRK